MFCVIAKMNRDFNSASYNGAYALPNSRLGAMLIAVPPGKSTRDGKTN
jgi:hypothetical protein